MGAAHPLRQQPQALKALMGIRDLVLGGAVTPGARLSEVAIAERLGISRTPIRAALARLEQEGLVEILPSGGYAVRRFSRSEVSDAIELRGVLEGTAARLAAERGAPPDRLAALKAIVEELDGAVADWPEALDFDRYVELNAAFHDTLAGLSGSETIRREVERVKNLPFASPSAFLDKQADVPAFRRSLVTGQAQHRAIVEAIEMREGTRAEALAREHARLARANLEYVMEEDRSLLARVPALALVNE
ncbi:GntR family transcriptional regulator [Pelagibacterium xiamenense]|uniref:GntR family transcriptional regulator n=1 Tax=Pelagibacterium xiamenense TaxID=2901140 RepID=UPI001E58269F|nr:GntR family transcriptional regulator [Pelagibacterium xiamenense]MCD7059018.1 GntR family transcriptional regulator [Pelagibacterium xiamenense]